MMAKRAPKTHAPYGQLGRAFNFTRDDLAANRAGYMTLPQQFGFKFWERKLYTWALHAPPIIWFVTRHRRRAIKLQGTVKKHRHARLIHISSGGGGGGYADVLEQHAIQIDSGQGVVTFYVRQGQYNALPEQTHVTLYYDQMEHRILSVEPPYDDH